MKACSILIRVLFIALGTLQLEVLGDSYKCKPGQDAVYVDCNLCRCTSLDEGVFCSRAGCLEKRPPCHDEETKTDENDEECVCYGDHWYCEYNPERPKIRF